MATKEMEIEALPLFFQAVKKTAVRSVPARKVSTGSDGSCWMCVPEEVTAPSPLLIFPTQK